MAEEHFAEAATAYAALVAAIAPDQWTEPGLGEWDLRALVGHTSRSLVTVESYLGQLAAAEDLTSPAGYLAAVATVDPASVADRGRAAGAALGDDPAAAVRTLVDRVVPLVAGETTR
jgi:Mycothiol maleylpyruvate isomerase N-terminal domain